MPVACPFFMPVEKLRMEAWLHAERLPLGCGWSGHCTAPGHEDESPSPDELREFCNLGYADGCGRCHASERGIRCDLRLEQQDGKNGTGARIQIRYVCEREHRPVGAWHAGV